MIVFSLLDLPMLLDVVVSFVRPIRTRKYRYIPANVIFLAARYAHHLGGTELLDELMFGALERIENNIHVSAFPAVVALGTRLTYTGL